MKLLAPYPGKNIKYLVYSTVTLAIIVIICKLVAVFLPPHLAWGFDHLTFSPYWLQILLIILVILSILPSTNNLFWNKIDFFIKKKEKIKPAGKKYYFFALISLTVLFVFWFLRSQKLWGDGEITIRLLERTLPGNFWESFYWREPLDRLITILVYRTLHAIFDWNAWKSIALISCVGGAIYIFCLLVACIKITRNTIGQLIIFLFMITMGKVQLFFGHVENYTLVATGTMAFILFSTLYLQERVHLFIPIMILSITVCIHPLALALFPSLVYLAWLEVGKRRKGQKIKLVVKAIPVFLAPIALLVVTCLLFGAHDPDIGINRFARHPQLFLPIEDVFNIIHLKDIFNEHILISPIGLITIVLIFLFLFKKINFSDPQLIYLFIASACFIIFTITFHSTWEQKRDWDVLSTAATPYTFLAGYLVITTISPGKYLKYVSLVLVATAFLNTAPWLFTNWRGLSRYPEDYLSYHQQGLQSAYQGNFDQAIKYFSHAVEINPEFSPGLMAMGIIHQRGGDLRQAEHAYQRIVNQYFSGLITREAHFNLGVIYATRRQYKRALKHLRRIIEMDHTYPQAQVLIRNLETGGNDISEY
ncbi:MAG: tetratricopeptide repeat protein [Candidatus Euphemobacter frigidus]|nr:tetratricopeptide repeat protein [Candidatus Euphemobacter frigidus]MDP8275747.1 tetratricopeptide repeat protein [Candidatus Euphemobacter frigidus]